MSEANIHDLIELIKYMAGGAGFLIFVGLMVWAGKE